jgi:hypothetical protein
MSLFVLDTDLLILYTKVRMAAAEARFPATVGPRRSGPAPGAGPATTAARRTRIPRPARARAAPSIRSGGAGKGTIARIVRLHQELSLRSLPSRQGI